MPEKTEELHSKRHTASGRLNGIDFARFLALIGMVIVNFDIVLTTTQHDTSIFSWIAIHLQGKAAATFVVLAGIGFGLQHNLHISTALKRILVLLIIGIINMSIFPADIIHFYAFYFLLGFFYLKASNRSIGITITVIACISLIYVIFFDYDKGWNWETLHYADMWSFNGFFRHVFLNGWHPVFPWGSFLLFGIWLSRMPLSEAKFQKQLMFMGGGSCALSIFLSQILMASISSHDAELALLFGTSPIPPTPLYLTTGAGFACFILGACLIMMKHIKQELFINLLTAPGRQTLTLYIAHIILGIKAMEYFDLTQTQSSEISFLLAIMFCLTSSFYATVWSRKFRRGPMESLLHRITHK